MTEEEIRAEAIEFAKHNKNRIAKELTDPAIDDYIQDRYTKEGLENTL